MAPELRGNSFYTIVDGPSWTQAEANSVKLGGHLVSIGDQEENQFLVTNFANAVTWNGRKGDTSGEARYTPRAWIGLNDIEEEGVYKWTSGEQVSFRNTIDSHFSGMNQTY